MIKGVYSQYKDLYKYQDLVFLNILGEYPDESKFYYSPFRKDSKKGCRITYDKGKLFFIDNATHEGKLAFNMFDLVKYSQHIYNFKDICNYIKKVARGYRIVKTNYPLVNTSKELPIKIKFTHKPFTGGLREVYGLTDEILNEDPETFLVKDYWRSSKESEVLVKNPDHNPHFTPVIAYHFKDTNKTKLYFTEQRPFRWFSNCTNEIFNSCYLNEFDNSHIVITKSKQDALLLYKVFGIQTIAKQQEYGDLNLDISNFKNKYVLYDNDITGLEQGRILAEKLKAKQLILPYNDPCEMFKNDKLNLQKILNNEIQKT